jgi:hypothetical protein
VAVITEGPKMACDTFAALLAQVGGEGEGGLGLGPGGVGVGVTWCVREEGVPGGVMSG